MGGYISLPFCESGNRNSAYQEQNTMTQFDDIESTPRPIQCKCMQSIDHNTLHNHDNTPDDDDITRHIGTDVGPTFEPILKIFPTGPLYCNTIIIGDPVTREAVLIDPGGNENDILIKTVKELNVTITKILLTHSHFDHILGINDIREFTEAPVYIHTQEKLTWEFVPYHLQSLGLPVPTAFFSKRQKPDGYLSDGMELGILDGICIHTPGHTDGSCSFYFPQSKIVCSGDTLFRNTVGSWDMTGGNKELLLNSVKNILYTLPDATTVLPGHGPKTSIGREKRSNSIIKAD